MKIQYKVCRPFNTISLMSRERGRVWIKQILTRYYCRFQQDGTKEDRRQAQNGGNYYQHVKLTFFHSSKYWKLPVWRFVMVGSNGKNQGVKCQLMTFFKFKPALDVRLQFAQIFPLYYFVNLPSVTNTKTSISTHLSLSLSVVSCENARKFHFQVSVQ